MTQQTIQCPHCARRYQVKNELAGQEVLCKACNGKFRILVCPGCQTCHGVKDQLAGRGVRCTVCGSMLRIAACPGCKRWHPMKEPVAAQNLRCDACGTEFHTTAPAGGGSSSSVLPPSPGPAATPRTVALPPASGLPGVPPATQAAARLNQELELLNDLIGPLERKVGHLSAQYECAQRQVAARDTVMAFSETREQKKYRKRHEKYAQQDAEYKHSTGEANWARNAWAAGPAAPIFLVTGAGQAIAAGLTHGVQRLFRRKDDGPPPLTAEQFAISERMEGASREMVQFGDELEPLARELAGLKLRQLLLRRLAGRRALVPRLVAYFGPTLLAGLCLVAVGVGCFILSFVNEPVLWAAVVVALLAGASTWRLWRRVFRPLEQVISEFPIFSLRSQPLPMRPYYRLLCAGAFLLAAASLMALAAHAVYAMRAGS